jgi:hypothetical protein
MKLTEICTCDDFCDSPCPRHARENSLENELIALHKWRQSVVDMLGMGPGERIANADGSVHPNVIIAIATKNLVHPLKCTVRESA